MAHNVIPEYTMERLPDKEIAVAYLRYLGRMWSVIAWTVHNEHLKRYVLTDGQEVRIVHEFFGKRREVARWPVVR